MNSPFGFGPRGIQPQDSAQDPAARKSTIDRLASDTQVPANVLFALEETGETAEQAATRLAAEIKAGKRIEDIVPRETMSRAYDIADALYPAPKAEAPAKEEPGVIGDAGRRIVGSLVSAGGGAVDAVGAGIETALSRGRPAPEGVETPLRTGARALGEAITETGKSIQGGVSEDSKLAIENSMPGGDLFEPSTWTLGKNPSFRGYTMLAADVLGSFLPVVATAVLTKSPVAAAGAGGAIGGGAGMQTARDVVAEMEATPGKSGGTVLEEESSYFRELLGQGMPRPEALKRTVQAAEQAAFLMTTPVSAFGGAATGKILGQGFAALASKGLAVRAAGTAGLSAVEEGVQEAAESAATRQGINTGAGTDLDLMEGTFGDFILGALGGSVPGAVAGAFQRPEETVGGDDGSVLPGPAAVPGEAEIPPDLTDPGAAATQPPLGPIASIAASAPDLTPQPEPEPPAPKMPDFKPGKAVRLADPETGIIHDAVFLSETPDGAMVRIAGGEFEIDRATFDDSMQRALQADEKAAGKKPKATKAKVDKPKPVEAPQVDTAAADALKEQGYYDGPWNDQNMPKPGTLSDQAKAGTAAARPTEAKAPDLTPEEALKRARIIEDTAARGGWTKRLKDKHASFMAIVGGQDGTEKADQPDAPQRGADAAGSGRPDGTGSRRDAGLVDIAEPAAAAEPATGVPVDQVRPDGAADNDGTLKVAPITTPPDQRVQPDMLGGEAKTETEMATREKRRKEWGRFLGIVEGGSSVDDSTLEGRDVLIRRQKIVIRAQNGKPSDQDYRLDTAGMDRDAIAAAVRGALSELDRRAPLPVKVNPGTPAAVVKDSAAAGASNPDAGTGTQGEQTPQPGEAPATGTPAASKTPDATKSEKPAKSATGLLSALSAEKQARVAELQKKLANKVRTQTSSGLDPEYITLGGELVGLYIEAGVKKFNQMLADFAETTGLTLKQAQEPMRAAYNHVRDNMELAGESIEGMDDAKAVLEEARKAIQGAEGKPAEAIEPVAEEKAAATDDEAIARARALIDGYKGVTVDNIRERAAVLRGLPKDRPPVVPNVSLKWDDTENGFVFSRKHADIVLQAAYVEEDKIAAEATAKPAPTAAEVKAAAAVTDPDPTPAQAEAENYRTGKVNWRGLDLSIENAKGSTRRKVTPHGKTEWEVVMPAHYGRILGTTGADGDHVDFYMGPDPKSENVWVIDQRDMKTGEFDEHKVMLGFKTEKEAKDAYFAGFSDGNGPLRLMSMTPMSHIGLLLDLKNSPEAWKGPMAPSEALSPAKPEPTKPVQKSASPAANRPFPDFKGKLNGPYWDDRSEDGRFNAEKNGFHEAGLTFFRAAAKILKDEGWTEAMPRGNRKGAKPIQSVSSNKAGPAVLGEVSFTMMGPDGSNGIYAQLGESFSGGNRAQMMWRINQASNPYGSGTNQFMDPTGMTPQQFAEKVIEAHGRVARNPAPAKAPTAADINAAMLREAQASGRLEIIGPDTPSTSVQVDPVPTDQDTSLPDTPAAPVDRLIEGTVEIEAADTMDSMEVTVSPDGPWDFNDTFPSPDPVQVGRLEVEGRSPFDANTPEEVVSILDETMADAVDAAGTLARWEQEVVDIGNGRKPRFTVPKGADPLEEAVKNQVRAKAALDDTVAAVEDVWGPEAAKAFRDEATARAGQSLEQNPPAETKAPPVPTASAGLAMPDSSEPQKPATIGASAKRKPRNEQRSDQGGDQGQPDLFSATGPALDGTGRAEAGRDGDGRGEGDEGNRPEQAGSVVGSEGRVPDRVGTPPPNFTITPDFALGSGTDGQKLEANLAALRLIQTLEAENRYATAEEQAVLARWVGWGGLKTLFDDKHKGTTTQWGRGQAELRRLLTNDQYYAAMKSTNDAHYTSRTVVGAMWEAMRNFGFTGGRALEPTIGSGNFLGLQPADLSAQTDWFASELDPVTGKIAKHLYPRATVFDGMGFQDAPFRPATFDVAIGNPPFGGDNSRVGNKKMHPDLGRMKVHNFVIAKTGQLLREGGIMSMVVTHRFLDAMDAEARDVLAPGFHFLGAVRLPNTAFKANAGTEVTTDIVFFQKRRAGDEQGDTSWMQSGAAGPNGTKMNAWFANNPDMILGRPAMDGTMYAGGRKGEGEFTVHDDGRDLAKALTEAMGKIKASLPDRITQLEDAVTAPKTISTLPYGEMMVTADGKIFRGDQDSDGNPVVEEVTEETFWKANAAAQFDMVEALRPFATGSVPDAGIDLTQKVRNAAKTVGLLDLAGDPVPQSTKFEQALADAIPALLFGNPTPEQRGAFDEYAKRVEAKRLGTDGFDRLKGLLDLRGRMKALIRAERNDDPAMEQIRGGLKGAYTAFRAKYGYLNSAKNEAILNGDVGAEMALEIKYKAATKEGRAESGEEAPILTKRVIFPHKLPENMERVEDAIHVSMQEKGYVDPGFIMQLTKKELSEVITELTAGERPMAFKNPATGRFEMAESYLSGNLAEKIEKATQARAFHHIPHLKAAMPPPKTQEQITPSIRSMWIPQEVFKEFLGALGYNGASVLIASKVGMVSVTAGNRTPNDYGDQFKTGRMSAADIFEAALKGKIPVVFDEVPDGNGGKKRVKNEEDTKEAVAAYERISAEFPNWVYTNPIRAAKVVDAFNERVNVVTPRKYDGTRYLRTVGTSPLVELRNSQKNGAWRMIQDKVTLLHHVVGAGKTMTVITGIMERKRMGLSRKALVVVPNHLTGQWGKEWLELYPAANILVPTEKDFDPANRSKLINRIATGDFDAVIIGHSQLVKIDNDPEIVAKYVGEELDALNDAMQQAKKDGTSRRTVGQMANRIDKLKGKLQSLNDDLADRRGKGLLSWPELGIDYMAVDESQEFKNLEYSTTATQLVGMNDPNGSQKAFDLLMKLRALEAMPQGGATFATGTPISNSLVEIYGVMKYLIPESLAAMGIQHFDAWKSAFIQDQSRFEYTASMQLKERNVMSGLVNLGPLAELYRSFADIVMRPDVERMYREQMEAKNAANPDAAPVSTRFPTPKIKGGKRKMLLAPPTDNQVEFTRYLVMRMTGIQTASDKKAYAKTDNPLWVLTDARKASVDIRTIDPMLGREEGSKVVRSSAEVFRIYEANKDRKGTQLVFCDMSTPSKNATKAANAILKDAYAKLGLKKDALKRRIASGEGKTYSARWSDVLGEIEELVSSPATDDATRDRLNLWMTNPEVQDASAAMFTADTGFSFYDDMKAMLVEKGIPENEIAFIHDYDTTAKKKDLFEAVNEGRVRVLIGSTMKMGAGTNAQRRLVALHHIDTPWRPSDMEQREGRIIRQGNLFYEQDPDGFEVEINAYSTEKTSDVVQWQVLERKAKGIETFLNAAADTLVEEGGDADQYAEFMAQSTGKKVFLEKMQVEKDLINAKGIIASALRSRSEAKRFIEDYDEDVASYRRSIERLDGFTTAGFPAGADAYMADWNAAIEVYRAERDKAEAEADEVRKYNVSRDRKDWKKLPAQPNAPKRWLTRPSNGYDAAVYDALEQAQDDPGGRSPKKIPVGRGFVINVYADRESRDSPFTYSVVLATENGSTIQHLTDWGGVTAKDFRNSDKLLAAFDPARIVYAVESLARQDQRNLQRLVDMKPRMEEVAARQVDDSRVKALTSRLAALTAETRIEEVKYAEETAKAGTNHFASIDTKGRNLALDQNSKPLTGQFQFTNAGRQYASVWGAPGGRRRIEETDKFGDLAYFEATDMDSNAAVIVEAVKLPPAEGQKEGVWRVLQVYERTQDGAVKEMRGPDRAPVAVLNGNELGPWEDIRQLGKKAEAWYRDNLIGTTVVNKAGGMAVQFRREGGRKVSGRKGDVLMRIVPALREIIADGIITSTEADAKGNPDVTAWHTISATVTLDGKPRDVVVKVKETADGSFHYDLSRDMSDGARHMRASGRDGDTAIGLEDNPVDLNMDFLGPENKPDDRPVDDYALRLLTKELNEEAEKHGLAGKITVRAVRQIVLASGARLDSMGVFDRSAGEIQVKANAGSIGPKGVMRHEIIHALRNSKTWGKEHGLFTAKEWNTLERAALADKDIRNSVLERYPDLDADEQIEEMVAELYRLWADDRDSAGTAGIVLEKIMGFFEAMANLLRGNGYLSAAGIMEEIANGTIGGAAPTPPGGGRRTLNGPKESDAAEMRAGGLLPAKARTKWRGLLGSAHWKDPGTFASNTLTDAMAGKNGYNALAIVPGRALFAELGKRLLAAKTYLRAKEEMDALRNDWHGKSDEVAQIWRKARNADPRANDDLMDLMHRSTLSGVDPSKPDTWKHGLETGARREISRYGDKAPQWAKEVVRQIENHKKSYATLKELYNALPPAFQDLYRQVRAQYDMLGDEFEKAVLENVQASMKVAMKRAEKAFRKEMERIKDEGLKGQEKQDAIDKAQQTLDLVKARGGFGAKAKIAGLRKQFESNKLKGPYFPLARFGQFYVTVRNGKGEVTSFSRFEKEAQQQAFIREQKEAGQTDVQFGVISDAGSLRSQVDPTFVADIEGMLADAGASPEVMDAIWQRWLETLPDQSIRTAKIHRKGREGWNQDAFRAFGHHMFHGSHQLARLKYGLELEEALNDAEDEARLAEDPNRAGLIVNEMRRRHEFTMNPQGSSVVATASSLSFVWYLGATPAAALANISQTTVVGPGVMAARFKKAGVTGALREITRAAKDFGKGRGEVAKSDSLSAEEKMAMREAYRRGTVDKTQAHDLASVAETGIEYNATRENIMRKIGWMFHHAERMNREITFLANYRLARADGLAMPDAIDTAADLTWKIHFDYQNTSRPRFMQNDLGKLLTVFRQFTVNLGWRVFRDAHQSFAAGTKEERVEARTQLVGLLLSMFAHAGIKGTYGYGILMLLLSVFLPGDSDDIEEWMHDALLMEGDDIGTAAWNYAMGAALNGVPGQIIGASLTERIGSPNIWFRGPSRDLEGEDVVLHYVTELLGPPLGIALGIGRGVQLVTDGDVYRGVEAAVPKMMRDILKAGRYGAEGVETLKGDDILESVNPYEMLLQASGFTPARIAERFDKNSRMKGREIEIMDERKAIHKSVVDAVLAKEPIPESALEAIRDFNSRYPEYPITADTIRQSAQGKVRSRANAEFGVTLNPKLAGRLRAELAPGIYN